MTDDALRDLAARAGIAVDWVDAADRPRQVGVETLRQILTALGLPCASDSEIAESSGQFAAHEPERAGAAPERCYGIDDVAGEDRVWGLALQLYGARRDGDGGIGDFGGAAALAQGIAPYGADALALSPTHALFAARPERYSPYAPSSRLFLNPLLADPALVFGADRIPRLPSNKDALIDWPARSRDKLAMFRTLFDKFAADPDFDRFIAGKGEALRRHALFETLDARFETHDWRNWPAAYRDPARLEAERADQAEIRFHQFLQWVAHRGMTAAQAAVRAAGLRIGFIADLAVGVDPSGSDAWSRQKDMLTGLSIGAPPDLHNPQGQNWGLTALSPRALAESDCAPFVETLRANMENAGGIRIDHAMGLRRLWLIPEGAAPGDGAYLAYPFETMLRHIARELVRHRAIVIAEDLGTVPPGFSDTLAAANILGMRILWFERDGITFLPPERWRREATAMTSTHDLPTVAGWWRGTDIATRDALGLYPGEPPVAERSRDRAALWHALGTGRRPSSRSTGAVVEGALRYVARTPSRLALIPLEDLVGEKDQPNLPGTIDEHPNWRRRQKTSSGKLLAAPKVAARLGMLKQERGRR